MLPPLSLPWPYLCLTSNVICNWQRILFVILAPALSLTVTNPTKYSLVCSSGLLLPHVCPCIKVSRSFIQHGLHQCKIWDRKQYFTAKADSCTSIIYLSTYLPFFLSYFLSLATSRISLFCRYCVLMKIFMTVPNKARLSTNIKSCPCHKCAGCHVTLKKADFFVSRTQQQSVNLRCIASIFLIVWYPAHLLHQMFLCHWISSSSPSSENYINVLWGVTSPLC